MFYNDDLSQAQKNGVTITPNTDGSFTLDGTSTDYVTYPVLGESPFVEAAFQLQPGTYTISIGGDENPGVRFELLNWPETRPVVGISTTTTTTLDISEPINYIRIQINPGVVLNGFTIYPQLELGSTATAYEPPQVTTTPINLDGNVLCSLPDGTCDELHIDGGGNVVLEKRTQTIQLDGDGTWIKNDTPYVHYTSPWSQYDGSPSGYSSDRHFIDKLPASAAMPNGLYSANTNGTSAYLREPTFASDVADIKEWMGANKPVVVIPLLEPQTIPLPSVTLPALLAPICNVYADAEASGTGYAMGPDVELEYIRDVNIALADLEAKIADLVTKEAANV